MTHASFAEIGIPRSARNVKARPWTIEFTWHDLLFLHWPVPPSSLRSLLPAPLDLDLYDGSAWVGVIPFFMSGIRLRGLPPLPGTSAFAEVNVRTYVRFRGQPGVYFFSLDAASRLAVRAARAWYHLPYFHARMSVEKEADAVRYSSERRDHPRPAEFRARYRPTSEVRASLRGSLEHWLTERYCLFTTDRRGNVIRAEIHHQPWPLQSAEVALERQTLAHAAGIHLPETAPLAHFSRRLDVYVWRPEYLEP
ncbi:MAG: YqjF family protein [Terriglobales bacterium]